MQLKIACYEKITHSKRLCSVIRWLIFNFFFFLSIMFNFAIMKTDRFGKWIKALPGSVSGALGNDTKSGFSNPRRYRLDFIAENTFNRVWTFRFSRVRLIVVSLTFVAAVAALMFVIVFFSPVRKLLPGRLEGDLRSRYVDMAMRLDSLEQRSVANDRYMTNLRFILSGETDSTAVIATERKGISNADSMLAPSTAERQFVQLYEASDRFNLSVLTPIAAEGMAFYSPVPDALTDPISNETSTAVSFTQPDPLPVSATYRGTVVSVYPDAKGLKTVVIQHPNDFISVYSGLSECFTSPGVRLLAGERIGHSGNGNTFRFELWHNGSATDPGDYVGF